MRIRPRRLATFAALLLFTLTIGGCGATPVSRFNVPENAEQASPLGPSYVLMPLPNEDDALLGRVLNALPKPGRSLEEVARPNPCAEFLEAPKETPLSNEYEDAVELSAGASAKAMLGAYGFGGDANLATHFVYKLKTIKRVAQVDTNDYVKCCREHGGECGYGYVGSLIYGEGEYATGEEVAGSVQVDFAFASGGGSTALKALHRRKVKGWIAAVVRVTDDKEAAKLTPFGVTEELGISEESLSDVVRPIYERSKVAVAVTQGKDWVFRDGTGETITENEFVRRYGEVTGSDELGDVESHRSLGGVIGFSLMTATGLGIGIGGIAHTFVAGRADDPIAISLMAGGFGIAVGGVIPLLIFIFSDSKYDGAPDSHALTEGDARIYAARHNRALLRQTIRKTKDKLSGTRVEVRPLLGSQAGIEVRF